MGISGIFLKKLAVLTQKEHYDYDNDIIVRYNPNNDTVEEFK